MNAKEVRMFIIGFLATAVCFTLIPNGLMRFVSCYVIGAVSFYLIFVRKWPLMLKIVAIVYMVGVLYYGIRVELYASFDSVLPDSFNTSNLLAEWYFGWFEAIVVWGILRYLFNKIIAKKRRVA